MSLCDCSGLAFLVTAAKQNDDVMNSTPARDFLLANRRSNTDLYPDDWKKLPVPDVPQSSQKPIVDLVERILKTKRSNADADTSALEKEIDERLRQLYYSHDKAGGIAATALRQ